MRFVLIRILICVAGATTVPTTAPAGGTVFTPPVGWTKVEREGQTIYVAPDAKEGDSTAIVLWPAGRLEGDFAGAFKDHRMDAQAGFDPLRSGEVKSFKSAAGDEALSVQEVLQDSAGRKSLRNYFALRRGERMVVCMFVADSIEGFTKHAKEADAFIASLRFVAAATKPAR